MNKIYMRYILGAIMLIVCTCVTAANAMSSTNYEIPFDSINSGGTDNSSSTNYTMVDTVGEQATGYSSSTNYEVHAGYRQAYEELAPATLSFRLGAQENATQTTYTSVSTTGNYVIVASTASYATGSFIGVVENEGLGQYLIVGQISDIIGNTISVDKWDGMASLISQIPAGGNDYVYRMDGHQIDYDVISSAIPKTGSVMTGISTNASGGYTLRIESDGYFRASTSSHIINVADGAVTLGSEEYGASTHGTSATSTGYDFAVTTTARDVQISTGTADRDRIGMIYKVAITEATPAGSYVQTVRYLLTANF